MCEYISHHTKLYFYFFEGKGTTLRQRPTHTHRTRILPEFVSYFNSNHATTVQMGKSQKKRAFRRHNPVRVPDSHLPKGLDAAESTSSRKDAVIPIIQKVRVQSALKNVRLFDLFDLFLVL